MEANVSLLHSLAPDTWPYPSPSPKPCEIFRNIVRFYSEDLLAPRPTPKLEDHPLSAVRNCLFNIFAATLHIWRPFLHPQPEDAPCRVAREASFTIFFPMAQQLLLGQGLLIIEASRSHFRHTTFGRTALDEWSARCRDLYLTTHNTHKRQTSMPPTGSEPTIPASERPQTHALDGAATGIDTFH
jgi:hypothetical protein